MGSTTDTRFLLQDPESQMTCQLISVILRRRRLNGCSGYEISPRSVGPMTTPDLVPNVYGVPPLRVPRDSGGADEGLERATVLTGLIVYGVNNVWRGQDLLFCLCKFVLTST